MQTLTYSPGQIATLCFESYNADGYRADGYVPTTAREDGYVPIVTRIIYPDLSLADDFPQFMTKIDVGLYYYQFTLPTGSSAVGAYLVDVMYWDPITITQKQMLYQILVSAPFGLYSATSF